MESPLNTDDQKRLSLIKKMIIEMGGENFDFRVPTSPNNDIIEAISVSINMLADKLAEAYKNRYLVNSRQIYEHLTDVAFILDQDFTILQFTASYTGSSTAQESQLIGKSFKKLLDKESQELWSEAITKQTKYPLKLPLKLKAKKKLTQPLTFFLNELLPIESKSKYLVTGIRTLTIREHWSESLSHSEEATYDYGKFLDLSNSVLKNEEDISIIKEIHAHIEKNRADALGSLQKLANDFGTNEFKLKNGFKELYGITVFKFQMEERLIHAKVLVESTSIPIKSIAVMMGFKTLAHFSRSFKKRFGSNPRELRK